MKSFISRSKNLCKLLCLFILLFGYITQNCFGQEVADSKLRECLPMLKVAGGLKRTPIISDPGQVTVRYAKVENEPPFFEVNVAELPPSIIEIRESMKQINLSVLDGEDGDGNTRKQIIIREKYKGEQVVSKLKDGNCDITFYVGKKFQVKLTGNGTNNVKVLYEIIETMALDKLEKLN